MCTKDVHKKNATALVTKSRCPFVVFFDFAANKFAVERQAAGGRAFCWLRLTQGKMGDFKSFGRLRLGLRADSNGPF